MIVRKAIIFICLSAFLKVCPAKSQQIDTSTVNKGCKYRLSEIINSYQPALLPVLTIDGNILFFDRKVHPDNTGSIKDEDDIWISEFKGGNWQEPQNAGRKANTIYSDVLFWVSPDRTKALIYQSPDSDATGKSSGFIFSALDGIDFRERNTLRINNYYNLSKNYYAALSYNGKVLLLSIQREDSHGSMDLYVSFYRDTCDCWTEPKNLGNEVNTPGLEVSPFIAYDNKTLYFATNKPGGFGKLDIYMSKRLDDSWTNWSEPVNLGSRFNSKEDDHSLWITKSGDTVFYYSYDTISKRQGLYRNCLPEELGPEPYMVVHGRIFDETFGRLSHVKTEMRVFGSNKEESGIYYSLPSKGDYFLLLPGKDLYSIDFSDNEHEHLELSIDTRNNKFPKLIERDIVLKRMFRNEPVPQRIVLYFDYDSDILPEQESAKLRNFLKSVPDFHSKKFRIVGHTDSSGTEQYNDSLSKRRAETAAELLSRMGVNRGNFEIKWEGFNKPASNLDNLNRRVEISVKDSFGDRLP